MEGAVGVQSSVKDLLRYSRCLMEATDDQLFKKCDLKERLALEVASSYLAGSHQSVLRVIGPGTLTCPRVDPH